MENSMNVRRQLSPAGRKFVNLMKFVLIVGLILGAIFAGRWGYNKYSHKLPDVGISTADLDFGINYFPGFAKLIEMNGGLKANKESRMYKEFGITVNFMIQEDALADAFKAGTLDALFVTTDIMPISMDVSGDYAKMKIQQFVKLDDSRGVDLFLADASIKKTSDLRGKKIAVALGWPCNTLLHLGLEAGGLTEKDVIILTFNTPAEAKEAYINKEADAAVVWFPDNLDCMKSRPTVVLMSTELMPNIIMDGFMARQETINKKFDKFVAFSKALMVGNAELSQPGKMEEAAQAFKTAFASDEAVSDIVKGMKLIHFATYGDNLNFFGLNTDFTGITGEKLYTKMSRVYKNGYNNNLSKILAWSQVSNSSVVEAITGLTGAMHAAEGQIKFSPASPDLINAPAVASKQVTVNFATASYVLTPSEKERIDSEIGETVNELSGFRIRIQGNTDNTGNRQNNIVLSKQRAQAVVDYLVSQYHFDPNKFIVIGNGPDKPVASNDTETGRAANRRTDFEFIGQ